MITTTLIKPEINKKFKIDDLFDNMYLLPNWEKIKEFSLSKKSLLSFKSFNVQLYRKLSSKNMIEKYSLRVDDEKVLASMDLKVYKDSVYIINIDAFTSNYFDQAIEKLLQVAVEKALYNTSEKEVRINLSYGFLKQKKIKNIIEVLSFELDRNQSKYEVEMFGETYRLNAQNSELWQKRINQMQILINK